MDEEPPFDLSGFPFPYNTDKYSFDNFLRNKPKIVFLFSGLSFLILLTVFSGLLLLGLLAKFAPSIEQILSFLDENDRKLVITFLVLIINAIISGVIGNGFYDFLKSRIKS